MNNRFNPGDKVYVCNAQEGIQEMQKMIGQVCTIQSVYSEHGYCLEEDQIRYIWMEWWLEPYEENAVDIDETEILNVLN